MRKRPLQTDKIELFKDVSALFLGELEAEKAKLAEWEQDKTQMALWRMRPVSPFLDRAITKRHTEEIKLRERALRKLGKVLRCGALTRSGNPCQCKPEEGKRRCRYHGGKSTGPKTQAGRDAIRESNRRRAEARRTAQGGEPEKT